MPRGRPRVHVDDAARAAAWRDRQATSVACGEMALTVLDRPTTLLIQRMSAKIVQAAEDPAAVAVDLVKALLDGIEEGAGRNAADAARNFVRYENREAAE